MQKLKMTLVRYWGVEDALIPKSVSNFQAKPGSRRVPGAHAKPGGASGRLESAGVGCGV